MNEKVKALSDEARKLSPAERAALIEDLLTSLDRPDPGLDAMWAEEAEARLAAFERGEMTAKPVSEIIDKLRSQ